MSAADETNYGPLVGLIGVWTGDKGMDLSPEPAGDEETPYFETLTFEPAGQVTNAEEQSLAVLRYHQVVSRKADGEVFHDETGYWMWDAKAGTVMHSLTIPRGVCVLAGGRWTAEAASDGPVILQVEAAEDDPSWGIVQSPFMKDKARTKTFRHKVIVGADTLSYEETMVLDIYGRTMDHTDANTLVRQ